MKKQKVPALVVLHNLLANQGMDIYEIDALLSRFLEEEAEDYLDFIKEQESFSKKKTKKKVTKKSNNPISKKKKSK